MKMILIYDVPDDRLRGHVADICLDYGLHRIQYSAFFGELSRNHQEEIMQKIKRKAGKKAISVHIFPLCETDLARCKSLVVVPQEDS
jgi:CRISPR-associated protein Cas2